MFCAAADEPWKRSNAYVMSFSGDWKDLSAKFVLQVWRDYCLTHNRLFLDDLYELCRVFMCISTILVYSTCTVQCIYSVTKDKVRVNIVTASI